jgi:hypothetical protein
MRKNVLVLATSAAILACGAIAASAQAPDAQTFSGQQTAPIPQSPSDAVPNVQPQPPSAPAPLPEPPSAAVPFPHPSLGSYHRGMMGLGHDPYDGRRGAMGPNMMGSMMMRMMFALMDADGDGKLSLQEFQAAQERIFKAMDANKDGFVTLQEMQNFMRGTSTPFHFPQE